MSRIIASELSYQEEDIVQISCHVLHHSGKTTTNQRSGLPYIKIMILDMTLSASENKMEKEDCV